MQQSLLRFLPEPGQTGDSRAIGTWDSTPQGGGLQRRSAVVRNPMEPRRPLLLSAWWTLGGRKSGVRGCAPESLNYSGIKHDGQRL